jgi:7-cyano-7-deazaguanine synthase
MEISYHPKTFCPSCMCVFFLIKCVSRPLLFPPFNHSFFLAYFEIWFFRPRFFSVGQEFSATLDKAIVLLSGGIDSAVALWISKSKWQCSTLTINYYQRHKREIEAAATLARLAGIKNHIVLNMGFLKEVADSYLIDSSRSRNSNPIIMKRAHPTYVPGRNILFYGTATSLAESMGAKWVVGGHHREDNRTFPDSTPGFFRALNKAIREGTWAGKERGLEIVQPLSRMTKSQVILRGVKLDVPFRVTYSCYEGRQKACGRCEACLLRLKAFEMAGIKDPALYE